MPQIGPLEILVVCVVALIVFGPKRLPEIARQVGKAMAELRRQASDVRSEFQTGMNFDEEDTPPPGDELPVDQGRVADGPAPLTDAPTRELGYPATPAAEETAETKPESHPDAS